MPDLSTLTGKQAEIYQFIRQEIESMGYAPAIRDIGTRFKITSPNGVMCHLKALEKKGFIRRPKGDKQQSIARGIQLTDRHGQPKPTGLPFLGRVAAGTPIEAIEDAERMDLNGLFEDPDHFLLQVRGMSMIEDHIEDGDFVVIRKLEGEPEEGMRVVAVVDGDATLKKFHRRNDGRIELIPANSTMKSIIVEDDQEVEIKGVLVGVLRKCLS
jgi:repressor LexA